MKAERWRKIERLYHSALKREKSRRAAFLARACAGDESLRHEVESLLTQAVENDSFLETPVLQAAAKALAQKRARAAGAAAPLDSLLGATISRPRAPGVDDPEGLGNYTARADGFHGTQRFELRRCLGAGGFGVVYEAYDREHHAVVALKTLQQLGAGGLYRFKQEFRSLADIAHPNLIALYELSADGEHWFFTMELVEGVDFLSYVSPTTQPADYLARPGMDRLRGAFLQLAEGVRALHQAGKLHCDLKPSNVLVERSGRVVILDFGLVAESDPAAAADDTALLGTPAYMSPEQVSGLAPSPASDWYSVGVMLFEALTGQRPFRGSVEEILDHKRRRDPPAPADLVSGLPPDLDDLCRRLLSRDPRRRPAAEEVLRGLGGDHPDREEPWAPHSISPAPLIGRERQLAVLRRAFDSTRTGQMVTVWVHGPSGVGKTALMARFLDDVRQGGDPVVLAGRCYEREAVPYKALDSVVDNLGRYVRSLPPSEAAALVPRHLDTLTRLFPVLQEWRARSDASAAVDDVSDPKELRRRGVEALRQVLDGIAVRKPVVLFIDDLQWGDEDSADLLADLIRGGGAAAVLMVVCYRSEEAGSSPVLRRLLPMRAALGAARSTVDLALHELDPPQAAELASELLEVAPSSAIAQAQSIAREAQGNPFFIGELVRYAQAPDVNTKARTHAPSINEVIQARCSRLSPPTRRLLEVVAVAGQPVDLHVARRAARISGGGHAEIHQLRAAHMVRTRMTQGAEQVEAYHDRIREVTEASIDQELLKQHHYHLATEWEASSRAPARVLAIHFRGAGVPDKTFQYAVEAANQAETAFAFASARDFYGYALEALPNALTESPQRDGRELALRRSSFMMTNWTKGIGAPETATAADRGAALAEKIGDPALRVFWVLMRGNVALNLGDLSAAGTLADQGLELALQVNTPINLALAYSLQMATRYFRGDLVGVEQHFSAGLPFFDDPGVRQILSGAMIFAYASWTAWMMGHSDLARERLDQLMAAESEGNQYNLTLSEAFAAITLAAMAEYQEAETLALRVIERAEKYQLAYPAASARCSLGFARAHLGRAIEGVALLRQGMAALKEFGGRISDFRCHLAQAQMCAGAIGDALGTIEQVIADSPYDIEALRLRGKLLHRQGQREAAEADFRKAIGVAQHIGAKGLELRAATNFAHMLAKLGRREEARAMLAEIYGWFTEGFDTADLKDAKALLDELNA